MWALGDRLTHRHNPELGLGQVIAIDARTVTVRFGRTGAVLRLAATSTALQPVDLRPGRRVRLVASGAESRVASHEPDGRVTLETGRTVAAEELWPLELEGALVERLALGDVDPLDDFALRLDALHLLELREAQGLGSFLGGRIRLFPHQLHAAERATGSDPVRWLLADEVGLGKTVEACLILNRLMRTGRADRCLIVAPATLTVQWLGELWRKHHQVFVLLDDARLADVVKDHGSDFNPFDAHRQVVVSLETLVERPRLTQQAVAAGIDLLVVDEAHHLRRPPRQPGNAAWRAIGPIAALGRHVVLPGQGWLSRLSAQFAEFRGLLGCEIVVLPPREPEHKGIVERNNDYLETSFLPGLRFASPADFNAQLGEWTGLASSRFKRVLGCAPGADRRGPGGDGPAAADRGVLAGLA